MTGGRPSEIAISIECPAWATALPDCVARIEQAANAALTTACPDLAGAELSVLLADDATLATLNSTWRGKDGATNVLSFPATETVAGETPVPEFTGVPLELGDVALAFETCQREALAQDKPLADHLSHLVVHGVLHLLGYDHEIEAEAEQMEALEVAVLARLGVADPYDEAGHD